jgi:hypothetical protein
MLPSVEDPRTMDRTSEARDLPSQSDVLVVRYREAVWAWYAAESAGWGSRASARFDERIHKFENAAAAAKPPDRSYFLQSARLVRAGVLTEAKNAFDAGVSATAASAWTVSRTAEVPQTVEIGVLPEAADVAVVPSVTEPASRRGLFARIASWWLGRR